MTLTPVKSNIVVIEVGEIKLHIEAFQFTDRSVIHLQLDPAQKLDVTVFHPKAPVVHGGHLVIQLKNPPKPAGC